MGELLMRGRLNGDEQICFFIFKKNIVSGAICCFLISYG